MRIVTQGDATWRTPGVGSGDVGWLLNCSPKADENVLTLWARIVSNRDRKELPKVKIVTLDQGGDEWLKWRRDGLGGSEVGAAMGVNPKWYKDSQPINVWQKKLPEDHPQWAPETPTNEAMQRGRELEPAAREKYEALMGWKVEPVCVIDDDYPFIRASLDGLRSDHQVVVEIKCSKQRNHEKYLSIGAETDVIWRQQRFASEFKGYYLQTQYQMMVVGAPVVHFVAYSPDPDEPGDRFVQFEMYPERGLITRLKQKVIDFWQFVLDRQPPPRDWMLSGWTLPVESDIEVPGDGVGATT